MTSDTASAPAALAMAAAARTPMNRSFSSFHPASASATASASTSATACAGAAGTADSASDSASASASCLSAAALSAAVLQQHRPSAFVRSTHYSRQSGIHRHARHPLPDRLLPSPVNDLDERMVGPSSLCKGSDAPTGSASAAAATDEAADEASANPFSASHASTNATSRPVAAHMQSHPHRTHPHAFQPYQYRYHRHHSFATLHAAHRQQGAAQTIVARPTTYDEDDELDAFHHLSPTLRKSLAPADNDLLSSVSTSMSASTSASASSSTSAPLLPSSRSRAISGSSSHALFRPNPSVQYPARSDAAPVILNVRNPPPQPPPQPSSATSSSDSAEKPALDDGAFICDCKDHLHHDNVAFFSGNCPISIGPASPDSIILDSDSDYPGEGDSASHRGENCTVNCAIADADKTAADRLDNIPADMDSDDFDLDLFDDEDLPNGLADAKGPAQGHPLLQDLSVAGSSWLSISDDTLAMSESTLTSKSRPSLLMTATSDFDDSRFSTDSETVGQIDLYARFSDNDASSIFDPNDGKTKMLLLHDSTAHADVAAKDCLQTSATTPLMPVHTPCHDGSFLARLLDRADKPACHINSIDTGDSSVCAHKSDAVANACEAKPDTGGIHNQLGASKGPDSATLLSRHAPLLQEDRHIHPHLHTHNSSANDNEDENEDDFSTATSAALSVSLSVSSSQQSGSSSQPSDTAGFAQAARPESLASPWAHSPDWSGFLSDFESEAVTMPNPIMGLPGDSQCMDASQDFLLDDSPSSATVDYNDTVDPESTLLCDQPQPWQHNCGTPDNITRDRPRISSASAFDSMLHPGDAPRRYLQPPIEKHVSWSSPTRPRLGAPMGSESSSVMARTFSSPPSFTCSSSGSHSALFSPRSTHDDTWLLMLSESDRDDVAAAVASASLVGAAPVDIKSVPAWYRPTPDPPRSEICATCAACSLSPTATASLCTQQPGNASGQGRSSVIPPWHMSPSSVPPILLPLSLAATSASASESSADQVLGPEPPSFAAAPHTDASAFHLASAHAVQNASSAQGSAGHGGATTEPVCTVHGHGDASPTWQHLHRKCPPISASAILSLLLPTYHETIGRPLHMTPAQAFDHLEPFIPNIAFPEAYSRFTYVDQADMDSWVHDLESVQKVQYDCRAGGGRQAVHSSATQTIVAGAASGDGAVLTSPSNPTRRSKRIAMRAESANAGTPHGFPSDHATSTLDRTKRFRHDHSYSRHTLNT